MSKNIKINNFEQIETDQLIWEIENSKEFFIYEIKDSEEVTEILVKIINSDNSISY